MCRLASSDSVVDHAGQGGWPLSNVWGGRGHRGYAIEKQPYKPSGRTMKVALATFEPELARRWTEDRDVARSVRESSLSLVDAKRERTRDSGIPVAAVAGIAEDLV